MPVAFGRMDWNWFCHLASKLSVVTTISLWSKNSSNSCFTLSFHNCFSYSQKKQETNPEGHYNACFPLFSPWSRAWPSFRALTVVQLIGFWRNLNRFTMPQLSFLTLRWCKSYEFSGSHTPSFKFWSWATTCREPQLPIKHMITRVNNNAPYCSIKHIFHSTVFTA